VVHQDNDGATLPKGRCVPGDIFTLTGSRCGKRHCLAGRYGSAQVQLQVRARKADERQSNCGQGVAHLGRAICCVRHAPPAHREKITRRKGGKANKHPQPRRTPPAIRAATSERKGPLDPATVDTRLSLPLVSIVLLGGPIARGPARAKARCSIPKPCWLTIPVARAGTASRDGPRRHRAD